MAIVSKQKMTVNKTPFTQVIKCSADGTFTCELPTWVDTALAGPELPRGDTKHECLDKWSDLVEQYTNSSLEEKKVILFHFESGTGGFHGRGLSLAVRATVCVEQATTTTDSQGNPSTKYHYELERETTIPSRLWDQSDRWSRGERKENQIPFNAETEAFFTTLASGLNAFIEKLESLSETPESVLEFIGSGVKLLEKSNG